MLPAWLGQTILEAAYVGFIGDAVAITETSSAQAAPLIAIGLPPLVLWAIGYSGDAALMPKGRKAKEVAL